MADDPENTSAAIGPQMMTSPVKKAGGKHYSLPPCKVCGARGTGLHYGVNTCEPCKGFFRRSLIHEGEYQCRNNASCRLNRGLKYMCPKCRQQKCLDVGMSKESIKTGRYSLERHRDNTVAVKQLAAKHAQNKHHEGDNKQKVMQHLVYKIVETYNRLFGDVIAELEEMEKSVPNIVQNFMAKKQEEENTNGLVKPVASYREFHQILEGTGVEVDDRLEMWEAWTAPAKTAFARKAKFCKAVPGYKELQIEDQITLFKASVLDGWLIMKHHTFDVDHKCIVGYPDRIYELDKLMGEDYTFDLLKVVRRFQQLRLSVKERVMLMSFCLLSPDRQGLHEAERVTELQDQLLEPLLWLLRQTHPEDPLRFAKIVSVLTELRTCEDQGRDVTDVLAKLSSAGRMHLPDIVREIYSF